MFSKKKVEEDLDFNELIKREESGNSFYFDFFASYFRPSIYVESINDINFDILKEYGIKLIICDLDNTLVPHYTKFPTNNSKKFVNKAREKGFDFVLMSNNLPKRVSFFSNKLNLDTYISNAKKPFPKALKKEIKKRNLKSQEVVVIGDMLITDILAANFAKTNSILIKPVIEPEKEWNFILKWLERYVFKKLDKGHLLLSNSSKYNNILDKEYEIL